MKTLVLVLFMIFSSFAYGIEQDKQLHIAVSYASTLTGYNILKSKGFSQGWALALSAIGTMGLGVAKEHYFDKTVDKDDIIANGIGTGGAILVPVIFEF